MWTWLGLGWSKREVQTTDFKEVLILRFLLEPESEGLLKFCSWAPLLPYPSPRPGSAKCHPKFFSQVLISTRILGKCPWLGKEPPKRLDRGNHAQNSWIRGKGQFITICNNSSQSIRNFMLVPLSSLPTKSCKGGRMTPAHVVGWYRRNWGLGNMYLLQRVVRMPPFWSGGRHYLILKDCFLVKHLWKDTMNKGEKYISCKMCMLETLGELTLNNYLLGLFLYLYRSCKLKAQEGPYRNSKWVNWAKC